MENARDTKDTRVGKETLGNLERHEQVEEWPV